MKPTILQEIFEAKRLRVAARRKTIAIEDVKASAYRHRAGAEANRLQNALRANGISIIAEFKRASPSKGIINDRPDPVKTAQMYEQGGAKAISVLTEEDHFKGSLDDLRAVRAATTLPILQKDFVFDEYQIYEAALAGADAILLIVAMLDDNTLKHLYYIATDLGLDVLVEVHDKEEMERAARISPAIIGINNRDLKTFKVSLDTSYELIGLAPHRTVMVSESGLQYREDLEALMNNDFHGFLIGETLMTSDDPVQTLFELSRIPKVKVCGITNAGDADYAARAGVDALGFNFYPGSPRYITAETARTIIDQITRPVSRIGVFVNEEIDNILAVLSVAPLDALQLHGDESPEYLDQLRKRSALPIIKAFRVSKDFDPDNIREYNLDSVLLDTYSPGEYGGTGETFNWDIARKVQKIVPQMYLAGGLSLDNIKSAVRQVVPFAVDVCSGVEKEKGIKDLRKMETFILVAKGHI